MTNSILKTQSSLFLKTYIEQWIIFSYKVSSSVRNFFSRAASSDVITIEINHWNFFLHSSNRKSAQSLRCIVNRKRFTRISSRRRLSLSRHVTVTSFCIRAILTSSPLCRKTKQKSEIKPNRAHILRRNSLWCNSAFRGIKLHSAESKKTEKKARERATFSENVRFRKPHVRHLRMPVLRHIALVHQQHRTELSNSLQFSCSVLRPV